MCSCGERVNVLCYWSSLGTRGRERGEFTNLQGISASSNGRIVVADSNNQCIQVSACQWKAPFKRLVENSRKKQIITQRHVVFIDFEGFGLVNQDNPTCFKLTPLPHPVSQVFSNDGQFKLRFGVRGRSPGQLQRPTGVTVDTNGDIIVADYDNRWVSIFSSDGKFKVNVWEQHEVFKTLPWN